MGGVTASPAAGSAASTELTGRDRFLAACHCRPVDRPPLWLMRQAGRALPEYRALKERYTFLQLVQTPDLATEVTLQPIRRFGFDAAVIFSDILIAAEAMGQPYRFRDSGGIEMEFLVSSQAEVDRLTPGSVRPRLEYLAQALRQVRAELQGRTALLGFAGSPWTLANFMTAGGSANGFSRAKAMFHTDRPLFDALLRKITDGVVDLLQLQIDAGAEAVQIFDTLAEWLSAADYGEASGRWIREILERLDRPTPVLLYVRGAPAAFEILAGSGVRGFSVDWRENLAALRNRLPSDLALQGNLDPALMLTTPSVVQRATDRLLASLASARGHIVNLGHGLPPGAALDNIEALVTTVRQYRYASWS